MILLKNKRARTSPNYTQNQTTKHSPQTGKLLKHINETQRGPTQPISDKPRIHNVYNERWSKWHASKTAPCIHRPKLYAGESLLGATVTSGELPRTVLLTTNQPSQVSIIGDHRSTFQDLIREFPNHTTTLSLSELRPSEIINTTHQKQKPATTVGKQHGPRVQASHPPSSRCDTRTVNQTCRSVDPNMPVRNQKTKTEIPAPEKENRRKEGSSEPSTKREIW